MTTDYEVKEGLVKTMASLLELKMFQVRDHVAELICFPWRQTSNRDVALMMAYKV